MERVDTAVSKSNVARVIPSPKTFAELQTAINSLVRNSGATSFIETAMVESLAWQAAYLGSSYVAAGFRRKTK